MPGPQFFIGVVSHEGSRFQASQGPDGLAARLAAALGSSEVVVNTANFFDESGGQVTPAMVQQARSAELHIDRRWSSYLGQRRGLDYWRSQSLRQGKRLKDRFQAPSTDTIRRLLNIELSHLDLLRQGLSSGGSWVLILEDDAECKDVDDLAAGITAITRTSRPPAYVNLSASFSPRELGIAHLLRVPEDVGWGGPRVRTIYTSQRPVTNTVCAILYSSTFLAELVAALDAIPTYPVLPIDWKMNAALMALFADGAIEAGDCWLVEPAPIIQMSMKAADILRS